MEYEIVPKSEVHKIPYKSGIYIFFSKDMKPLYVGKAALLKNRILQHFRTDFIFQPLVFQPQIIKELIFFIGFLLVDSNETKKKEIEIIKELRPSWNIKDNDFTDLSHLGIYYEVCSWYHKTENEKLNCRQSTEKTAREIVEEI